MEVSELYLWDLIQRWLSVIGNRGSQGVGIGLSEESVDACRAARSEVHFDLGARVMAVRLLVQDMQKRDVGFF